MTNVSEQIIKKCCGSLEDRIAACCDEKVAQCLKQNICSEIEQKCNSKSLLDFVKKYVDSLIKERFQSTKK